MLSERLKGKEVYADKETAKRDMTYSMRAIDGQIHTLVQIMNIIERNEVMTRDEVENYVINRLEHYEKKIYGMTDEDFEFYLNLGQIQRDLRRKRR